MPYVAGSHDKHWHDWMDLFASEWEARTGVSITYKPDDVIYILDQVYAYYVNELIRPLLDTRECVDERKIDRHKIASIFEATIVRIQPIDSQYKDVAYHLNARFAFFVAKNVILGWFDGCMKPDYAVNEAFGTEHLVWLEEVEQEFFPVMSNAATWCLYETIVNLLMHQDAAAATHCQSRPE